MAPEYVHAQEHVDTLATYENAFIAYLLDLIEGDIEGILADIAPLVEPLEQRYEAKGLVYGERSFLRDLQGGGKPMKRSFLFESHSSQEVLALSRALRKRVKNIKSTEFYRFNAVLPAEKAVAPTNILVHDPLYGACYRHYLDRYVHGSANAKKEGSAHYYNYVVSLFLLHLKNDLPPDLLLSVDGGKIRFGSFSVKRGNYLLSFFDSPAENVIEIEATLSLRRSVSSKARYRLLIEKALSDATRPASRNASNAPAPIARPSFAKRTRPDATATCSTSRFTATILSSRSRISSLR